MQLQIVSQDPRFMNRTLKPYKLDGIDTVGVFGQEPFAITFRNSSSDKIQIRIAVDGTDVMTGAKADLNAHTSMWVVDPFDTMTLRAWPETTQAGAQFIFGQPADSVAAHTHGDMSARGYISVAIFVEGMPPAPPARPRYYDTVYSKGATRGGDPESYGAFDLEATRGPAVGAGNTVEQKIGTAKGLIRPIFSQVIQLRYLWWSDLEAKLATLGFTSQPQHPTGFEPIQKMADLGDTPRIGQSEPVISLKHSYSRFV